MPVAIIKDYNMEITIPKPTSVNIEFIRITVPIPDDDEIPKALTGRTLSDAWQVYVDIDTGKISGWNSGKMIIDWKVVDMGNYELIDKHGVVVGEIDGGYVPRCIPEEFGDYLMFDIQEDGTIKDWHKFCTEENVMACFFGEER